MAEQEPSVRALKMRLARREARIRQLEGANANLLRRLAEMMELFRAEMDFTDEYPPKRTE